MKPSRGLVLIVVVGVLGILATLGVAFVTLARMERKASQQRLCATKALQLARSGLEDAQARLDTGQDPGSFTGSFAGDLAPGGNRYSLTVSPQGGLYLNGGDPEGLSDYNLTLRRILGTLAGTVGGPLTQADGLTLIDRRPASGWRSWDQVRDLALGGSQARLDALRPYLSLHAVVDAKVIHPNVTAGMEGQGCSSWAEIKLARQAPDFERIGGRIVGRAPVNLAWARTRRPVLVALMTGLKGLYLDESTQSPIARGDRVGTLRAAEIAPADASLAADRILSSTSELGTWALWDAFCDGIPFSGTADLKLAKQSLLKANFNPNSDLNKFGPNASRWRPIDKSDLLAYSTEFSLLPPRACAQELESTGSVRGRDGVLLARRVLKAELAPQSLLTLTTQKEFVCEDLGDPFRAGDERDFRLPGRTPFLNASAGTSPTWGHALGLPGLGSRGASLQTYPEPCVMPGAGLTLHPADYDGSIQLATLETPAEDCYGATAATRDMKLLARYTAGLDLDVSDAPPPPGPYDPAAAQAALDALNAAQDALDNAWIANDADPTPAHQAALDAAQAAWDAAWAVWDATQASLFPPPDRRLHQPDVQLVTTAELGNGLWDAVKPNTLYPDGVYSEKDRAPAYFDQDPATGTHGVISFWIKPNHAPCGNRANRAHPFFKDSNFSVGVSGFVSLDQFFYLGDIGGWDYKDSVFCKFEVSHSDIDYQAESAFQRDLGLTPHRWALVTMAYDFRSPDRGNRGELLVDAGVAAADRGSDDVYSVSVLEDIPNTAQDITQEDVFGLHRFSLGGGRPQIEFTVPDYCGSGADATFDELAVYDFGGAAPALIPAPPATLESPGILAAHRFREGRYTRESGEYVSPLIRLPESSRLQALAWTALVPRELPQGEILLTLEDASMGRVPAVPFRLHAVFHPNPQDLDTPILDPLALDDLTLVYQPAAGRRILAVPP